jgi:hypothetical protein
MPAPIDLDTSYTITANNCWEWKHTTNSNGYGILMRNRKRWRAHRYFYMLKHGEIPEGLVLDHLCFNPPCVNPDHLEPVTQSTNAKRGRTSMNGNEHRIKTHCPYGHPYSGNNLSLFLKKNGHYQRRCKACNREFYHKNKRKIND